MSVLAAGGHRGVGLPARIRTGPATYHLFGQQDSYLAPGNHVNDISDAAYPTRTTSWYFLDGVEVMGAYKRAGVVVAFGDSITDGVGSTDGTNGRWPDFLARRLDGRTATRPRPSSTRASAGTGS